MKTKSALSWILVIILAMVVVTVAAYPHLPAVMTTHWGASNQPNGYMSRFWGAWAPVLLAIGVAALLWLVPYIDPWRKNFAAFRSIYNALIVAVVAFLAYLDFLVLAWNLGYHISIGQALAPAAGALLILTGALLRQAKPNWFVGVRTPWTLSSPAVWEKTHRIASPLFVFSGVIMALGALWPPLLIVGVGFLILSTVFVVLYSYFAYENERKRSNA